MSSHNNHYEVAYIVNYDNGMWTGPHKIKVSGRTLWSAWISFHDYLKRSNRGIRYVSVVTWKTLPAGRENTDPQLVAVNMKQIAEQHTKPDR
jgi:hypothetical protein